LTISIVTTLAAADQSMQQSGAASYQKDRLDTLLHGAAADFRVHWIQLATICWTQCITWTRTEVPRA